MINLPFLKPKVYRYFVTWEQGGAFKNAEVVSTRIDTYSKVEKLEDDLYKASGLQEPLTIILWRRIN